MNSKQRKDVRDYLNDMGHNAIMFDGLDDAIIGVAATYDGDGSDCVVYSKMKLVKHFMKDGMGYDEAVEYVEFNVECVRVSNAKNPIIVDDLGF
jgi:hypothetical protein